MDYLGSVIETSKAAHSYWIFIFKCIGYTLKDLIEEQAYKSLVIAWIQWKNRSSLTFKVIKKDGIIVVREAAKPKGVFWLSIRCFIRQIFSMIQIKILKRKVNEEFWDKNGLYFLETLSMATSCFLRENLNKCATLNWVWFELWELMILTTFISRS